MPVAKPVAGYPSKTACILGEHAKGASVADIARLAATSPATVRQVIATEAARLAREGLGEAGIWTPEKVESIRRIFAQTVEMLAEAKQLPADEVLALLVSGTVPPMGLGQRLGQLRGDGAGNRAETGTALVVLPAPDGGGVEQSRGAAGGLTTTGTISWRQIADLPEGTSHCGDSDMSTPVIDWTDARVQELKRLHAEGHSASTIAGILGGGCTRNAVIGKTHRLKLTPVKLKRSPAAVQPRRAAADKSGSVTDKANRARQAALRPKSPVEGMARDLRWGRGVSGLAAGAEGALRVGEGPDMAMDDALPLPKFEEAFVPLDRRLRLVQLTEHTCKWPIGDPLSPDFYFCGGESLEGKPYCEFHTKRSYAVIPAVRKAAAGGFNGMRRLTHAAGGVPS